MTRKGNSLFALLRVFGGPTLLVLITVSGIAAEVHREQFSKTEIDRMGYPTNVTLAAELGRSEARRDLTNGIVRLPVYGLPSPSSLERIHILKEKYQIDPRPLAGCVVTSGLVAYADGYSEISRKFIEAKHGTNFWMNAQVEAEKAMVERLKPPVTASVKPGEHQVRAGDTLSLIARDHGVTLKSLIEANPKLDPARLKIGQVIQLPPRSKR